jgi:hypothetical protein
MARKKKKPKHSLKQAKKLQKVKPLLSQAAAAGRHYGGEPV